MKLSMYGSVHGNIDFSGEVQWSRIILSVESEVLLMKRTSLNDMVYSFEPLKIVEPDPNHKVDESELHKSIQKSNEIVALIEEYKRKSAVSNS